MEVGEFETVKGHCGATDIDFSSKGVGEAVAGGRSIEDLKKDMFSLVVHAKQVQMCSLLSRMNHNNYSLGEPGMLCYEVKLIVDRVIDKDSQLKTGQVPSPVSEALPMRASSLLLASRFRHYYF